MFLNENSTPITWAESVGSTTTQELYLGRMRDADTRYYWGYISDFRILRGTALDYEYPTAKLSTVTDTKLLLQPWQTATTRGVFTIPNTYKQDEGDRNLYYDYGGVRITTENPYKSSSIGSFMFDGSNNSQNGPLKLPKDEFPFYNVGINDFTMEWWFKMIVNNGTGASSYQGIFWGGNSGQSTDDPHVAVNNSTIQIYLASNWQNTGFTPATGVWYHFALVRDYAGNSIKMFINGKQEFSTTTGAQNNYDQWNNSSTLIDNCHFGNHGGYSAFEGLITDIRFVNNQALYTTGFTPPSYPLLDNKFSITGENPSEGSAITGTVMLFTQPGTGFTKNSAAQNPKKYFNTLLYTGNGGTQSITGLDFKPDLVWTKPRSAGFNIVRDSVRGSTYRLITDDTYAELSEANYGTFSSNGFNLGAENNINASSVDYVAWCWKAGGNSNTFNINGTGYGTYNELQTANTSLPASSTSGMIVPSGMSINTDAGFSIVSATIPTGSGNTVPHGFDRKPDLIIWKSRNLSTNWEVYHSSLTPDGERKLYLNSPASVIDSAFMNDTSPTSSVFSVNVGSNQSNHIVYCWHSVEGYSKFGSYTGNGSTSGNEPFIYTGFKPAWLMIKRSDTTNDGWYIYDNARSSYNVVTGGIRANASSLEDGSQPCDFLANGFRIRIGANGNFNATNGTYIFMAFAEQPFTKTTAR